MSDVLLTVNNLTVEYGRAAQTHTAVRGAGFEIKRGGSLALVGESGCGKSTIALALMGLLPKNESRIVSGSALFDGQNLFTNDESAWRRIRGKRIGIVFQDPFSSLNPVLTVGSQIEEALALDGATNLRATAIEMLSRVQLREPDRIHAAYPHQISGGQRQRAMIACALARNPDLLIADEPTTALDVTVQDEIIKLLRSLLSTSKMSLLFITHNLGLVKNLAHDVAVMRRGEIVESGATSTVLTTPVHPYTTGLLQCMPTLRKPKGRLPTLDDLP